MLTNSGNHDQVPQSEASNLDLQCLPMSDKEDFRLIIVLWVNNDI